MKMKTRTTTLKWFQFYQRIVNWRLKRNEDELAILERAKERSIGILQKRYGYTKEEATIELRKHYSKAWLG
jgi:hypothetical protein